MDSSRADERSQDRAPIDLPYAGVTSKYFRVSRKIMLLALSGAILTAVVCLTVWNYDRRGRHPRYIKWQCAIPRARS